MSKDLYFYNFAGMNITSPTHTLCMSQMSLNQIKNKAFFLKLHFEAESNIIDVKKFIFRNRVQGGPCLVQLLQLHEPFIGHDRYIQINQAYVKTDLISKCHRSKPFVNGTQV